MQHNNIYNLIKKLWPLNRSLAGVENRKSLKILKEICPHLMIKSFKSGSKVFDWTVPN